MTQSYLALVPRPLEPLCLEELTELGVKNPKIYPGAVSFQGNLETLYRVNLFSRCAMRILVQLDDFLCQNTQDLYEHSRELVWEKYLSPHQSFSIKFQGTTSAFRNSMYASQVLKDGILDRYRECFSARPSVDPKNPALRIHAQFYHEGETPRCAISIDSSGTPLFQRGYRFEQSDAPIKENLAAALLRLAQVHTLPKETPVVDPFCGSGTFLIEAAWMKLGIASRKERSFAFEKWPDFNESLLTSLLQNEKSPDISPSKEILCYGFDKDPKAIRLSSQHVSRAHVTPFISLQTCDIEHLKAPTQTPGIVICNPPYGHRLSDENSLIPLYRTLGNTLKRQFGGWKAYVFTANLALGRQIGLHPQKRWTVFNGPLEGRLLLFEMY